MQKAEKADRKLFNRFILHPLFEFYKPVYLEVILFPEHDEALEYD